jgi:porin
MRSHTSISIAAVLLVSARLSGQSTGTPTTQQPVGTLEGIALAEPKVLDGLTPSEGGDSALSDLADIGIAPDQPYVMGFVDPLFDALRGPLDELDSSTGLRIGVAYTTVFQLASGGINGFSGDLDIMTAWTLVGRGTKDTGTLVFTIEDRFRQADQPTSAIRGEIGSLQPPQNGFNDRGWVVRDVYWLQRFFEGQLRVLIGRADLTDFGGGHRLQNLNNSFSNRFFSANPTVAAPGHGPAVGASFVPNDLVYVSAGLSNAYGTTTTSGFSTLDEADFFYSAELGLTPRIDGLGAGRYQLYLWRMDERSETGLPRDQGVSVILNQELGDRLLAFGRWGYSDAKLSNIRSSAQAGIGYTGLFGGAGGRGDSLTGFAASWGEPRAAGREEKVLELFHRFQVSRYSQFTVGGQIIIDPSNSPSNSDAVGILTLRYRVAF